MSLQAQEKISVQFAHIKTEIVSSEECTCISHISLAIKIISIEVL
jgi:hypothetical protein